MRKNRNRDMTPYNMEQRPCKQNLFLMPFIWLACFILTRRGRLKINKKNVKGLKPPYLILSEHQGFTDYFIAPLVLFPNRANYISDVEGFAAFGNWLYRQIGCIPTRRYVSDINLIKNIKHAINKNKSIVVVYPEARHSTVGTNTKIPNSVGKLIKLLKVPVVILKMKGSYLSLPVWDETNNRTVYLEASLEKILDLDQIKKMSSDEITELVNEKFYYDEYTWQRENNFSIKYNKQTAGLDKVLYLCPNCHTEFSIVSHDNQLDCTECKKVWYLTEKRYLESRNGKSEFDSIPKWYEYERNQAKKEIDKENYFFDIEVIVKALPNVKGFVSLGLGNLVHDKTGFTLKIFDTKQELFFPTTIMNSVHNEYDYKGKGQCIVLSKSDCCYYLYPKNDDMNVTKIQFACEYFYDLL